MEDHYTLFWVFVLMWLFCGCGSIPTAPVAHAEAEATTEAEITPTVDLEIHAEAGSVVEAVTSQQVENLQQTIQEQGQAQQSAVVGLTERVRDIGELVQNVQTTVRTYGLSPEKRKLLESLGPIGAKLLLCVLACLVGTHLLCLFAPSVFRNQAAVLGACGIAILIICGGIAAAYWTLNGGAF